MTIGQIRKALSGFYYIYAEGKTYQTRARGNFRKKKLTPLVGDKVEFESTNETDGYILKLLPRENRLTRPPVANVDLGVIVMSAAEPAFSQQLLDRFLVQLEAQKIKGAIYLSKLDLLDAVQKEALAETLAIYERAGYSVIFSGDQAETTAAFAKLFRGKLTVFIGQSGAGKSTLLNLIVPELELATGEISQALGRGRHTTRHVELLPMFGGLVADTPGFSSLELDQIKAPHELGECFPEIRAAAPFCKFRGCLHRHEPGCEVKSRVEKGQIASSRYEDYLTFLQEIEQRKPVYGKKKEK